MVFVIIASRYSVMAITESPMNVMAITKSSFLKWRLKERKYYFTQFNVAPAATI